MASSRSHNHRINRKTLIVVTAAEVKQAVLAFLVRDCGGQFKRTFPIRASDLSDDEYNPRLKQWLYEKARSVTVCTPQLQSVVYSSFL